MSTITDNHYFQSLASELDSKLGRINSLIQNHPAEKGSYHEYILKDLICNFLPKRYSIRTGFIYVDDDHISPQIDLMIIDENQTPCILAQYDDFVIVYPEAVCSVIEVKTYLNKTEFKKSVDLIQEVKTLSMYNNRTGEVIGGIIFAFDGIKFTPNNLHKWYKSVKTRDITEYPEAIISLKKGLVMKWNINNSKKGHYYVLGDDDLKWKSLSIINGLVIKYCELRAGVNRPGKTPFHRFSRIDNLNISNEYLLFGKGLQIP
ncbi:MAG TPA: hypothetical protein PLS49_06485 [Candidatus Woesebacteria bacterium]|nr:hypothetical protein [Candidatus Woesebacteria bacterium]